MATDYDQFLEDLQDDDEMREALQLKGGGQDEQQGEQHVGGYEIVAALDTADISSMIDGALTFEGDEKADEAANEGDETEDERICADGTEGTSLSALAPAPPGSSN
jgi:hypothetical protein